MTRRPDQEADRWFAHATDEFQDADALRQRDRFYLALFHFQQAADKALKAFLYSRLESIQVLYTHSVDELVGMAAEIDHDFDSVADAKKLDQYYVPTRYPNSLPGSVPSRFFDDPDQAEEAMTLAKAVISLVEAKLTQT